MLALILLILILLIVIIAVGSMAGSRNGLPPASSQSSLNGQRNQNSLVSPSNANRINRGAITSSQRAASSTEHEAVLHHAGASPIIIQPTTQKPVVIKPSSSSIVVRPETVETIKLVASPSIPVVIQPQKAVTITPSADPAVIVSPSHAMTVEPPPRGAWEERGWSVVNGNRRDTYEGFYAVGNRRFQGRIEARNRGRNVTAYIYNPPPEIKRHAHGACFQQIGNGWFLLHWARPARTVDDAILYMERVLDESLNR